MVFISFAIFSINKNCFHFIISMLKNNNNNDNDNDNENDNEKNCTKLL